MRAALPGFIDRPAREETLRPMLAEQPPTDDAAAIAYEQSIRALDQQAGVLDNIRARTSVLIAAMSLVATFLGGEALNATTEHEWLNYAAAAPLIAFALGIFFAGRVLQSTHADPDTNKPPDQRAGLQLTVNAELLLDRPEARGKADESVRAFVARCAQQQWDGNVPIIDGKLNRLNSATWALLAQAALWIALLIGKGVS
jgi:hypothetical protein